MNTLVIHPNDPTTQYLSVMYENDPNIVKMTEKNTNKEITEAIRFGNFDRIMMLGHGGEYGLYAPTGTKPHQQFGRDIISPEHVQFLREKECIAIWCNANIYAEKYGMKGLFTGMVISELYEAEQCFVPVKDQEEQTEHNKLWVNALFECYEKYPLSEIPEKMEKYIQDRKMTPLEDFNFNSVFYFD